MSNIEQNTQTLVTLYQTGWFMI